MFFRFERHTGEALASIRTENHMKKNSKLLVAAAVAGALTAGSAWANHEDKPAAPSAKEKMGCNAKAGKDKAKESCQAKDGGEKSKEKNACAGKDGCGSKEKKG
jgi:hypothetical protein